MTSKTENTSKLEISKILTVSTSHLSRSDATELKAASRNEPNVISSMAGPYGWLVTIPNGLETLTYALSPITIKILKKAQENGCSHVLFDRDGPTLPDFAKQWVD